MINSECSIFKMLSKSPTFLIKNCDPTDLYNKYKAGQFNRPIPQKTKLSSVNTKLKTNLINDNKYQAVKFVMSNEQGVEKFKKSIHAARDAQHRPQLMGGRCDYCKQDFEGEVIGYPLSHEPQYTIDNDNRYRISYLFWTEGTFCDYACCLGHLQRLNKTDPLIQDAEMLLKLMFQLEYGKDAQLKKATDPKLLIDNGGTLSLEDWRNKQYEYVRTNNVLKIPTQVIYAKQMAS